MKFFCKKICTLFIFCVLLEFFGQITAISVKNNVSKRSKKSNNENDSETNNTLIIPANGKDIGRSGGEDHGTSTDEDNSKDHGSSNNAGHDNGSSNHHVPPPSAQLMPHSLKYKPEGFEIFWKKVGLVKILIGFKYTKVNHYDRYLFRLRYHGYEEYETKKLKLNRTDTNELILNNFLSAQYIVCVTLYSSSGLPEYPPISTSDMCVDILFGEPYPIGGHHSSTGLLSPLLLAVAAVLLIIITIGYYSKQYYSERFKNHKDNKVEIHHSMSDEKPKSQMMTRNDFSTLLHADEDKKWQTGIRKNEIVQNASGFNLKDKNYYNNYGMEGSEDELEYEIKVREETSAEMLKTENITSLQSLGHVLDNKPWVVRKLSQELQNSQVPVFYIKK